MNPLAHSVMSLPKVILRLKSVLTLTRIQESHAAQAQQVLCGIFSKLGVLVIPRDISYSSQGINKRIVPSSPFSSIWLEAMQTGRRPSLRETTWR